MSDRLPRREFIRWASLGGVVGLAGCGTSRSPSPTESSTEPPTEPAPTTSPDEEPEKVGGQVVDVSGEPLGGVRVTATVRGVETVAEATTNQRGEFTLEPPVAPVWLRMNPSGYVGRTVAAGPDAPVHVELTPREGTVSMSFGGDVMFGRRFYQTGADALDPRFRIRPSERAADHRAALSTVRPLLQTADITSVNLETPLTTTDWRHTEKRYSFVSHPVAADALADAGVDYAAIGNNHIFDALTPGLTETLSTLDTAGLAYSGAGENSEEAWTPAYIERGGLTVAMISCTTVTGDQYRIDWSADSETPDSYTVTRDPDSNGDPEELTFPGSVGTAEASDELLRTYVNEATENADVTVVQIHGGTEYERTPTPEIEHLSETASTAGADLVVNHHPHVTGGIEIRDGTLVAWSLGNLVFDQELWETYPSYLLTTHVTEDGVVRAYLDPLLIEGYVPRGVVAEPGLSQLRRTAGLSSSEVRLRDNQLQYHRDSDGGYRTEQRRFEGDDAVFAREAGWVASIVDGADAASVGTDLLPTGDFESPDIDDDEYEAPLWRFGRRDDASGDGLGRDGTGGLRLIRKRENTERAILSPTDRVPACGPLSLTGRYRYDSDARLELLWQWYASSSGAPLAEQTFELGQTGGEFKRLREDFEPHRDAEYVDFRFQLSPPASGEAVARFDELRLIEWSDEHGGRQYDHLRVDGAATVELARDPGRSGSEISWVEFS